MHKAKLTIRRYEILKLMAKGYTNRQIPKIIGISESNFKLQKWRLYCYLGAHSVKEAISIGIKNGLIL